MKKPLRTIAASVLAAAAVVSLSACGSTEPRSLVKSIAAGEVILGTKYDQPGLGLRHPDKSMSGLDVDVATYVVNAIADDQGVAHPKIKWRETPSAQRETLIKNGEVDMITATYSINKGRAKAVDFGGPYLITHQALLVRQDDNSLNALTDLASGRKLCSVTGSTPAQKIKDALPTVQLQEYDSYSSCVEALHQKKVDAMTTDATILYGFASQYEGEFKVVEMNKEDGKPFTNERYGIGHAKGDTASTEAINKALNQMYSDGSFERFLKENLGDDAKVVEKGKPGDLSFLDAK
ncbi:glutamate ABC transporter substrate-binding protein [Corynebacterium epidermidicanis]|uniref:L-glutamate-binding protein n=1 Tax=Corynebacterium epidermidicanis TaxID=1050174 RepID=A0A0G3GS05_9CORY|nr:glutamate ABC transporter substrate-binding protein [Corynebacterium epidermidicanis]AKK03345.1 L-glutamate-binding protein [Corynebacterium epidermidicanis]